MNLERDNTINGKKGKKRKRERDGKRGKDR